MSKLKLKVILRSWWYIFRTLHDTFH